MLYSKPFGIEFKE